MTSTSTNSPAPASSRERAPHPPFDVVLALGPHTHRPVLFPPPSLVAHTFRIPAFAPYPPLLLSSPRSLEQHPPLVDAVGARRELARDEAVQLATGLLGRELAV